jgi:transcriptional regulator with XRE-family HTH domain
MSAMTKNALKELRKTRGLSQKQLGDMCMPPIPDVYISRYENGKVGMKEDVVQSLAVALDVAPGVIRYGETTISLAADNKNPAIVDDRLYKLARNTVYEMVESGAIALKGEELNDEIIKAYNIAVQIEAESGRVSGVTVATRWMKQRSESADDR